MIVDTNAASLDLAQRQHEAGNINDLALAQQQASYSRSRLDVASTEADTRRNREKLNRLLGLWGVDTDWQIAGELPEVPNSDLPIRGSNAWQFLNGWTYRQSISGSPARQRISG